MSQYSSLPTAPGSFPETRHFGDEYYESPTIKSSCLSTLKLSYLNLLLIFVPLGVAGGYLGWDKTMVFGLNFLAIVPLAKLLGFATEEAFLLI